MTQTLVAYNIGNYLLDCLYDYGVKHIFGIPGDYILQFDKLIEQHKIKYINATSENSAGNMADAYGRLRGLGVVCITYGVGINISNALAQAYAESSPLVVISGAPNLSEYDKGQKLHHLLNKNSILHQMDTTQLEIFSHFTIDQAILTSAEEAKTQIDRVLWSCQKHKKPVYIEIPRGMALATLPQIVHEQETSQNLASFQSTPTSRAIALHPILEQIKHLLQKSEKPVIWAGHEILRYHLSSALIAFAAQNQIPIASTLLGKTVINEDHPLSLGVYQGKMSRSEVRDTVEKGDCLLMLGGILSDVDTGIYTTELNHQHKIFATAAEIVIDGQSYFGLDFADFIQALAETAQLAAPERRTIGIVGDGAFQMTATELSTAARYKLDPIMIVLNNQGYGTERPLLEGEYNDIHNWNYSFLPKLLNCGVGIKVSTEDAFDTAFKAALTQRGQFHLIEVELDKTDFSPALNRFLSFVNGTKTNDRTAEMVMPNN
ncbi:MAG: alpha-keto acid decarboxylase family protein [Parachlamydiaceae bacterium]|nr:alpha-keto acid decarboxylase family protein [Parachlamydiaceae bacterium]